MSRGKRAKAADLDAEVEAIRAKLADLEHARILAEPLEPWETNPDGTLKLSKKEAKKIEKRRKKALAEREEKALTASVEGVAALDAVRGFLTRFIVFPSDHAAIACTLWAAHTHVHRAFDMSPLLLFSSPTPGSGKSNSLDLVTKLAPRRLLASHMTASLIAREINADPEAAPLTIALDEYDTIWGRHGNSDTESLRKIFNDGAYPNGNHPINVPAGHGKWEARQLPTYTPKALAGLSEPPDTVASRSIVIRMRRKLPAETVEIYRVRKHELEHIELRDRLGFWAVLAAESMTDWPDMPDELGGNRNEQKWEALVALADAAGGEWPRLAREAAIALTNEEGDRAQPHSIRLLSDVRRILGTRDRIRSTDLLGELLQLEEAPWEHFGGTGIDSQYLSRTFGEFEIPKPHPIRFDSSTGIQKGWYRSDFADTFARYLPEAPTSPVTLPIEND
ncbi:DUF3631 domain-containing protein [Mycetocola sp.]|uniref:DUF3631 domain-containing protein n=1 Tax=Mycetocola sp. TaxID=1871042 RepID=UPI00398A167F